MRVSELTRQKLKDISIDLGDGDSITLTFDLNGVTPAWVSETQRRDQEQDVLSLPKCLSEVIIKWDVTNEDGSEYPPLAENISVLSYGAQSRLLTQIMTASVPSDAEGNASSGTPSSASSSSTQSELTSQNGQLTSPSPAPSASPSPT